MDHLIMKRELDNFKTFLERIEFSNSDRDMVDQAIKTKIELERLTEIYEHN